MKSAFRVLGKVRDIDVILLNLKEFINRKPTEEHNFSFFVEHLEKTRDTALTKALKQVSSQQYQSLLKELSGDIRSEACLPAIDDEYNVRPFLLKEIAPIAVGNASLSLFAYDKWLHGCYVSEDMLHRMRVSFKQMRYLLEFLRESFGKEVKKAIQICRHCQELLGEMQDNCMAADYADKYLASIPDEERSGSEGQGITEYINHCRHNAVSCAEKFLDFWSDKGKKDLIFLMYRVI